MSEAPFASLRLDALKWRELAAADGGAVDPKAEEMLALLDEYDRLRRAVEGALEWWDGQQTVTMPAFLEDVTALMIHMRAASGGVEGASKWPEPGEESHDA